MTTIKGMLLCCLLLLSGMIYSAENKFVVVIDPGHGGRDGGAVRGKVKEKTINLEVALALGELIKRNMKDVKVVYTRNRDVFVDLNERAVVANKAKANLFISIHTNSTAAKKTTASGADTYILGLGRGEESLAAAQRENSVILLEDDYSTKYEGFDPNSPESYIIFEFMTNKYMEQSLDFATSIQNAFRTKAKRKDRGVRQAGFLVLRKTSMPSVLVELGFINNQAEATYLSSKHGQKAMAESIYAGFYKYKTSFDKKQGATTGTKQVAVDSSTIDKTEATLPTQTKAETKAEIGKGQIEYRIQILYSDRKLPANSPRFKGLSPVGYYQEKGYKYTYGSTADMAEIEKLFRQVKVKFKDAFVIQLKDGKRVK